MTAPHWTTHYDPSVPATLAPYPERTLLDYVEDGARERPSHAAIWFKGRAISMRELVRASDAFAVALAAQRVKRGDRVGIMLPNCSQFLIAELAAWKLGAIAAPINPMYSEEELVGPLNTIGAEVIVALTPFYERLKAVQGRTPVQRVVVNIKDYFPPLLRALFTLPLEKKSGSRIMTRDGDPVMAAMIAANDGRAPDAAQRAQRAQRAQPTDIAVLMLSGGTTGTPKAVPGRHIDLVMTGLQVRAWVASVISDWNDQILCPLPLFHAAGGGAVQTLAITGHNTLILVPNPRDITDLLKTLRTTKPKAFAGVPTLYNAMLQHPLAKSGKIDFSSLKACVCEAAPLMFETKKRFEAMTGKNVIEGYAMTESMVGLTATPMTRLSKDGSVGVPMPDVEVRVVDVDVDDPTMDVAPGAPEEILLRAPQMMKGYWNNPEESALMLFTDRDGKTWLRTGDLGHQDADGYVFIVDRKKDFIKANGMQVWPREIEETIARHPAVAEVGVRGFVDEARGEISVAFVVLRDGAQATADEIRQFCKANLAFYKVPSRVVFRTDLPKSLIGKVLRRFLTLDHPDATV
jgi:long-chain acyl-CoA synthetase